ncbi:MAG: putative zinc-binding metallopeptidase [Thiothrix sp.]
MKRFYCTCGQEVMFEDSVCPACGQVLGFNPEGLEMLAVFANGEQVPRFGDDGGWLPCALRDHPIACNWLVREGDEHEQCCSCRLTRTIPTQTVPINVQRWKILEAAKRRLVYSLLWLGLPIVDREQDPAMGLVFDFLEDQRTNPLVKKRVVFTGHKEGVITLHAVEADDVHRIQAREQMNERYRTVLGHMRHESGHYFWDRLIRHSDWHPRFRRLFGSEENYRQALDYYYTYGPPPNWVSRHISAYASAHPWEDWAETWAHYLHIMSTLETANAFGVLPQADVYSSDFQVLMQKWEQLTVLMNSLNRSMGMPDAYPFWLTPQVVVKLRFIHQVIAASTRR